MSFSVDASAAAPGSYNLRRERVRDGSRTHTVVFFDVDGTLVKNAPGSNTVHRDSFAYAIDRVYGVDAHIDEIPHQGMTDMWIIDELLERRGWLRADVEARMPACVTAMVEYCDARRGEMLLHVLPGVRDLLTALAGREDVLLGLVTGNIEQIGIWKLEACGLMGSFSFGGFGSDHRNRGELIHVGLRRALEAYPGLKARVNATAPDEPSSAAARSSTAHHVQAAGVRVFHVGDTLYDLAAAHHAGVTGIGVATGGFPEDVLRTAEGTHTVLPDLSDTPNVLRLLGLAS